MNTTHFQKNNVNKLVGLKLERAALNNFYKDFCSILHKRFYKNVLE